MSFLVINCGTSSVKMSVFTEEEKLCMEGEVQHLFSAFPTLTSNGKTTPVSCSSQEEAADLLLEYFRKEGFLASFLTAIGHRVVHGGEKYVASTLITKEVEKDLASLSCLAPLHNPPSIAGIEWSRKHFSEIPQIAVFDTGFHATVPEPAALYPIPLQLSRKYGIRRYGFHGIAHKFSWETYLRSHNEKAKSDRVILIHLGSGCSLAAVKEGRSVDTTMGFTPLDGLMMATRSGELDPSIVSFLSDREQKSAGEIVDMLNRQSGLLGISEKTADMQELLSYQDRQSRLAVDMFVYRIRKAIGAYIAVLEGVDALIFSGGIGENASEIRRDILQSFSWCGLFVDETKNRSCSGLSAGEIRSIHAPDSRVSICVVGCDENLLIAKEMQKVLQRDTD